MVILLVILYLLGGFLAYLVGMLVDIDGVPGVVAAALWPLLAIILIVHLTFQEISGA